MSVIFILSMRKLGVEGLNDRSMQQLTFCLCQRIHLQCRMAETGLLFRKWRNRLVNLASGLATEFAGPSVKWKFGAPCLKITKTSDSDSRTLNQVQGPSLSIGPCELALPEVSEPLTSGWLSIKEAVSAWNRRQNSVNMYMLIFHIP